jgi:cyclopropane fatty-acyl-phospholipid synthase-like methyltransferase
MTKKDIIHYYDSCETDYRLVWDLEYSHAMHAGYWDDRTKTLRDALKRENEILAEKAYIKATDCVLDAGCGVGGSAFFLAQTIGCKVIGISLSQKQIDRARQTAQEGNMSPAPVFEVMDYTRTAFPSQSFDVVWGLESICHAENKQLFIQEAYRLLKPKGRLIIADGFIKAATPSLTDRQLMQRWLSGWGVQSLESIANFHSYLEEAGFHKIECEDITSHILPSSRRLFWYSLPAIPLSKLGEYFGWRTSSQTENFLAARCQYQALKKGLWHYCIFCSEK